MNTNITREELYDKFVTKEYLHEELTRLEKGLEIKIEKSHDAPLVDIKSLILEIGDTLSTKIDTLGERLDNHIAQTPLNIANS